MRIIAILFILTLGGCTIKTESSNSHCNERVARSYARGLHRGDYPNCPHGRVNDRRSFKMTTKTYTSKTGSTTHVWECKGGHKISTTSN